MIKPGPGWIVNPVCLFIDKKINWFHHHSPDQFHLFRVLAATLSQTNLVPVSMDWRNSFVKPCMNVKNWFVYIPFQYNRFLPWFSDKKAWCLPRRRKGRGITRLAGVFTGFLRCFLNLITSMTQDKVVHCENSISPPKAIMLDQCSPEKHRDGGLRQNM